MEIRNKTHLIKTNDGVKITIILVIKSRSKTVGAGISLVKTSKTILHGVHGVREIPIKQAVRVVGINGVIVQRIPKTNGKISENEMTKVVVKIGTKAKVPSRVKARVVRMKITVRKVGISPIGTNLPRAGVPDQIGKDRKEV